MSPTNRNGVAFIGKVELPYLISGSGETMRRPVNDADNPLWKVCVVGIVHAATAKSA